MEGDSSLCEETSVHGIALGPAIMLERPLRGHEVDGFGSFVPFQQIRKIGRLQRLAALEASEQKRYNAPWSGQIEIGLENCPLCKLSCSKNQTGASKAVQLRPDGIHTSVGFPGQGMPEGPITQ